MSDNGCGIPADELPLAVASHATSKIATADDLFRVGTLGFRGEALASIAEVSRLVLRSRTPGAAAGRSWRSSAARPRPPLPAAARRAPRSRSATCSSIRPCGGSSCGRRPPSWDTSAKPSCGSPWRCRRSTSRCGTTTGTVFDLPGTSDWLQRIAAALGRPLAEQLIWVESADGPVRLAGYVAHPSESRSNNRSQYLFLNGRHIRDRSLQHALGEAYRGLLMTGRFPVALLSLTMPPEQVDVNVHPTKLEVRFQNAGQLYSQLLATLRTKFLATDLTARVQTPAEADPAGALDAQQAARRPAAGRRLGQGGNPIVGQRRGRVGFAGGPAGLSRRGRSLWNSPAWTAPGPRRPKCADDPTAALCSWVAVAGVAAGANSGRCGAASPEETARRRRAAAKPTRCGRCRSTTATW